jgi:hypothetical protein
MTLPCLFVKQILRFALVILPQIRTAKRISRGLSIIPREPNTFAEFPSWIAEYPE